MKYFTRKWWDSGCKDISIFDKYSKHIDRLRNILPNRLLILNDKYSLHDARIINIAQSGINLSIFLIGFDRSDKHKLEYNLIFKNVISHKTTFSRSYKMPAYGDLGFWEVAYSKNNLIFRAVFSSHAEIEICFKDFDFTANKWA